MFKGCVHLLMVLMTGGVAVAMRDMDAAAAQQLPEGDAAAAAASDARLCQLVLEGIRPLVSAASTQPVAVQVWHGTESLAAQVGGSAGDGARMCSVGRLHHCAPALRCKHSSCCMWRL